MPVSRQILCVSPRYGPAFGTLHHAYPLTDGVKALMPPQGLLVVAAALPGDWEVRFVDENMTTATDADFAWADAVMVRRPGAQVVFRTLKRRPLGELPIPAYEKADLKRYFLGSIQFSSGCPYECEFCDIPALYGRVPQLKLPQRIVAELDRLVTCGVSGRCLKTGVFVTPLGRRFPATSRD